MPDNAPSSTPAGSTPAGRTASAASDRPTACLVLADGSIFHGHGFGATGEAAGLVSFNTAMSGYQEVITDPASTGQIIAFTFPHIGTTGTNPEDDQSAGPAAVGIITRNLPGRASSWRSTADLADWMTDRGVIGIGGVDTRRLTLALRRKGSMQAVLAHDPAGVFDIKAMAERTAGPPAAPVLAGPRPESWTEGRWTWADGITAPPADGPGRGLHVVVLDHGAGRDALRALASTGAKITVLPGDCGIDAVLAQNPDGIVLSHGPGDPRGTDDRVLAVIRELITRGLPVQAFGFGHQLLARALGAKVIPLPHGHHGANHPVRPPAGGQVEITTMNHGFAVDGDSLPADVRPGLISLFDGSNCGLEVEGRPIFSTQHMPGPAEGETGFDRLLAAMRGDKPA